MLVYVCAHIFLFTGLIPFYLVIMHALCGLLIFFKNQLFEKFFQEYHQSVQQFGSGSFVCLFCLI